MFNTLIKSNLSLIIAAVALPTIVFAQDYKIGDLIIDHPVVRATAPGAKVGAGYLTIENTGTTTDRLIGGTAEFSAGVEGPRNEDGKSGDDDETRNRWS